MPREMKRGDLYPPITGTVSDADGPVPLGTASSASLLLKQQAGTVLITCPLTVVDTEAGRGDPDAGKWTYSWQDGDTATPGTYAAEVEVIWPGSEPQTFPNDDAQNETFIISQDLNP